MDEFKSFPKRQNIVPEPLNLDLTNRSMGRIRNNLDQSALPNNFVLAIHKIRRQPQSRAFFMFFAHKSIYKERFCPSHPQAANKMDSRLRVHFFYRVNFFNKRNRLSNTWSPKAKEIKAI